MLFKTVLTSLLIGAISVNALSGPIARSPVPEQECESPRLFSTISYHGLTFIPINSPTTRGPPDRDLERESERKDKVG